LKESKTEESNKEECDELFEDSSEDELEENKEYDFMISNFGDNQMLAVDCVATALWGFATLWSDPEECLIKLVNVGGDVDTVCTVAGSLLGGLHGWEWIPKRWLEKLENDSAYGKDYVISLSLLLAQLDCHQICA